MLNTVVLGVQDLFDEVFWGTINNKQRGRWLVVIFKGVGVIRLQLGDMEDWVDVDFWEGKG